LCCPGRAFRMGPGMRASALRDTQPELALESLAVVERLVPGAPDTIDLGRSTRMPLRSRLMLELDAFWDSDSIRTRAATLAASHHFSTATRTEAAVQRRRWEADTGSGLEPEDGSNSIKNTRYHVGMTQRLNEDWIVDLHLGRNPRGSQYRLLLPQTLSDRRDGSDGLLEAQRR